MVERGPHPTDRRSKLVTATAHGAAVAKRAEKIMSQPPVGLTALSTPELEAMARSLESALDGPVG
jgi:DNA-binding MarR family transcriptional regulator